MTLRFLLRVVAVLALAGVVAFCVFGFLATFEYSDPAQRLPWQIGYGVVGLGCLGGSICWLRNYHHRADIAAKHKL